MYSEPPSVWIAQIGNGKTARARSRKRVASAGGVALCRADHALSREVVDRGVGKGTALLSSWVRI
jgi:hypothetical protein